jgi:LCP family protein required for cell wall assembly
MGKQEPSKGQANQNRKKVLTVLGVILALLLILLVVGYAYFHSKYALLNTDPTAPSSQVQPESSSVDPEEDDNDGVEIPSDLEEMEAIAAEGDVFSDSNVFNILLIGTDERTTYFNTNARGDSCILLSVNKTTMAVKLVSFERGTGVPILEGQYEGQWDWLTHTFRYGGADLMMKEIQECYKVDVTHYMRANIYTFMQLIDAVGGVDITLTQAEADYINHPEGTYGAGHIKEMGVADQVQTVEVGQNHLNGATAMVYARCRYIDSDWQRVERQRNVLTSIMQSAKGLNVLELNNLLDMVLPNLQTNLTEGEIASLMLTLAPQYSKITVEQMTIPVSGTYGSMTGMGGRPLYAVDFDANSKILQQLLYGTEDGEN